MFEPLKLRIPIIKTLGGYKKSYIKRDLIAGITVASVAVPQAMAYSQLAGVNLTAGLYAAMAAMLVFAILSSSRFVIMGPDAAMAALAGAAVIPLAAGNPDKAIALVAILAIFIGLFSIVAVFGRMSFMSEFISRPILLGYMSGLALVVIATQLPKIFGIVPPVNTNFVGTIFYTISNIGNIEWLTFAVGMSALVLGLILHRYVKRVPASLIILVLATALSWAFDFSALGVAIVGNIPSGLPVPQLPDIKLFDLQNLFVPAIAMMIIAYANTIATARTYAKKKKNQKVQPDQEFFGLGTSNVASGLFGGLPVSASLARTSVNYQSNAKTQVAQIFGAIAIGVVLVLLSPALKYLPIAVLAVIIILAVIPLFDFKELRSIWHAWRSEAVLAIITVLGVTLLGIYQGLLLAVLLAILNILRKSAFPGDAVMGITKDGHISDMNRKPVAKEIPGLKMYRFDAPLYFGNSNHFNQRVLQVIDKSDEPVKWFLWDAETITGIDSTSGQMLTGLAKELKSRKVVFAIARMKGTTRTVVHNSHHLSKMFQNAPHYTSLGDAMDAYKQEYKIKPDELKGK